MCYPSRFLRPIPFYWISFPPWFAVQHYICFLISETTINLTIYVYDEILIIFTLWCSNALPTVSWLWFNNSPHICIKMLTLELLWLNWFVTCIHVTNRLLEQVLSLRGGVNQWLLKFKQIFKIQKQFWTQCFIVEPNKVNHQFFLFCKIVFTINFISHHWRMNPHPDFSCTHRQGYIYTLIL